MKTKSLIVMLFVVFAEFPALAHHNAASHYELDKTIAVAGTVTRFLLINPHMRIYFDVESESGEVEHWLAEGNAAAILKRQGWTKDTLKPGDKIKITGRPARDSGHKVDWEVIELEDGSTLRGGNTVAGEYERQLDELEERRRREKSKN